jgi:hypothetical protein
MAFPCSSTETSWINAKTCLQNNLFFGDLNTKTNAAELNEIKTNFSRGITLLNNISKNTPTNAGLQAVLSSIGEKQIVIDKLKTELKSVQNDLGTAETRQENTQKPIKKTSFYESISGRLGFSKPLHTVSISILIAVGLFLLFTSGLMLKEFYKPVEGNLGTGYNTMDTTTFTSFFQDPRFYAVASGFTFVSILIGGLAYMGYLGKK